MDLRLWNQIGSRVRINADSTSEVSGTRIFLGWNLLTDVHILPRASSELVEIIWG